MKYPLFRYKKQLSSHFGKAQKEAIELLIAKIESHEYSKTPNLCLCGFSDPASDVLVSEVDYQGIPCEIILCKKCGLLRSASKFDVKSNIRYYTEDYRNTNSVNDENPEHLFNNQMKRGKEFVAKIEAANITHEINNITEIGCGAGGILMAFAEKEKIVSGFDFDQRYLNFGKSKGLNLKNGEFKLANHEKQNVDLVILSHVLEHFIDTTTELNNIIEQLKDNCYLLIEVPGVFYSHPNLYAWPVKYFQIAHVVQFFHKDFLQLYFQNLGLNVIAGDEKCTFILQKPAKWKAVYNIKISPESFDGMAQRVEKHLFKQYFRLRFIPDKYKLIKISAYILASIGLREFVRKIIFKK